MSSTDDEIAALRAKRAAMLAKSSTSSSTDDELAALRAKKAALAARSAAVSSSSASSSTDDELAALRAKRAAMEARVASSSSTDDELAALRAKRAAMQARASSSSGSTADDELAALRERKKAMQQRMSSSSSSTDDELAALKKRKAAMQARLSTSSSSTNEELEELKRKKEAMMRRISESSTVDEDEELRRLKAERDRLAVTQSGMNASSEIDDEIALLKRQREAMRAGKSSSSKSATDELARLTAEMERLRMIPSKSAEDDEEIKLLEQMIAKKEKDVEAEKETSSLRAKLEEEKRNLTASKVSTQSTDAELRALEADIAALSGRVDPSKLEGLHSTVKEQERNREKRNRTIDLCFLMDCTGSMGSYIEAAKAKVLDIAHFFETNGFTLRLAFVAYRDFDSPVPFEVFSFNGAGGGSGDAAGTAGARELASWLRNIQARDGSDCAEDVVGGFQRVLELQWTSKTRLVIHVADAPCHGSSYHSVGDDYPRGDPSGVTPEELLERFIEERIDYFFTQIHPCTTTMTRIFEQVYDRGVAGKKKRLFKVMMLEGDNSAFRDVVVSSVTASLVHGGVDVPMRTHR